LSRSLVFELKPLSSKDIAMIVKRAMKDQERGFGALAVEMDKDALTFLCEVCDGDARKALNALEIGVLTTPKTKDGKILYFCGRKCEKNLLLLKRGPTTKKWTTVSRQAKKVTKKEKKKSVEKPAEEKKEKPKKSKKKRTRKKKKKKR